MIDWLGEILSRHGQMVTLCLGEGDAATRAFIQPVTEKNEQMTGEVTGLGTVDTRLWLYLGKSAVAADDIVRWNGLAFRVRSSRPYYIGDTLVYWWAAMDAEKEAAL